MKLILTLASAAVALGAPESLNGVGTGRIKLAVIAPEVYFPGVYSYKEDIDALIAEKKSENHPEKRSVMDLILVAGDPGETERKVNSQQRQDIPASQVSTEQCSLLTISPLQLQISGIDPLSPAGTPTRFFRKYRPVYHDS